MKEYTIFVQTIGSMPGLFFNSGVIGDEKVKDAAISRFKNSGVVTAIAIFTGGYSNRLVVTEQEVKQTSTNKGESL